jgi:hypothetical protein
MQTTELENQMQYHDISDRVTRVEAAVDTLTGAMNEVSTSIKHIERSLASVGKTDMKTLLTIAGSVVTVAFTIWALLIAPITLQITDIKDTQSRIERTLVAYVTLPADVLRLEQSNNRLNDKMEAIERREAANSERAKFVEELVKDIGAQKGIKR